MSHCLPKACSLVRGKRNPQRLRNSEHTHCWKPEEPHWDLEDQSELWPERDECFLRWVLVVKSLPCPHVDLRILSASVRWGVLGFLVWYTSPQCLSSFYLLNQKESCSVASRGCGCGKQIWKGSILENVNTYFLFLPADGDPTCERLN